MQFAGQPEWNEIHKIKEIVQKHLIISNWSPLSSKNIHKYYVKAII